MTGTDNLLEIMEYGERKATSEGIYIAKETEMN
jgi:hypothetical protein